MALPEYRGQLDVLVNNIGVQANNRFDQSFADNRDEMLQLNSMSYVHVSASTPASCAVLPRV
jgi:short-subunit dehydrogenase